MMNQQIRVAVVLAVVAVGLALAVPAQAAPHQEALNFTIAAGSNVECQTLTVDTNTQLTITFTSVYTEASTTGQQVVTVFLFTKLTGQATDSFNAVPVASINSVSYVGALAMTAYADAGSNSRLCVSRSTTTGSMAVYATVNGFTTAR